MTETASLQITLVGQFDYPLFRAWIRHRAGVLNLTGGLRLAADTRIEIAVWGAPVLIDALEVACSLGPRQAQVDRVETEPGPNASLPPGFEPL